MKNTPHNKSTTTVKRSGNTRTHVERIDWEFRRLRNQAIRFFAARNRERRAVLKVALAKARTYSDVERIMKGIAATRGPQTFRHFMDHFFAARVNKRVS